MFLLKIHLPLLWIQCCIKSIEYVIYFSTALKVGLPSEDQGYAQRTFFHEYFKIGEALIFITVKHRTVIPGEFSQTQNAVKGLLSSARTHIRVTPYSFSSRWVV